jgi:6-phosphogluconolactonase
MATLSRRSFLASSGSAALGLAACSPLNLLRSRKEEMTLYVGTYTRGKSEGIYLCRMDAETGALTISSSTKTSNPSFLTLDRTGERLFAVNEVEDFQGAKAGAVSAFSVDKATGALAPLNQRSSRGGAPCYLTVDATNRFLLVANYVGGNAAVLPLQAGGLGEAVSVVQHRGSGPNQARQEGPHVHSVTLDPSNRFAYVADLGIDRLMVYRFDASTGALTPADPAAVPVAAGAGPRHFTFSRDGRHAYVITELGSTVTAFDFHPENGALTQTQVISTLPAGFQGDNFPADLHMAPSGRFLYGSNRGHDSIVVFAVDPASGALRLVQHQSTMGKFPRNFAIAPGGRFLLAANQNSDNVVVFSIESESGRLAPTGHVAEIPVPVCVRFA